MQCGFLQIKASTDKTNLEANSSDLIIYCSLSKYLAVTKYSGMNVRIVYESSTTSNIVGLSVRHNNTRIHVRVRQEVGHRQHGGMILCQ